MAATQFETGEPFGPVEQAVIRVSLHETYRKLKSSALGEKTPSAESMHDVFQALDPNLEVNSKEISRYIAGQNLSKATMSKIDSIAVSFLASNIEEIKEILSVKSYKLLSRTLDQNASSSASAYPPPTHRLSQPARQEEGAGYLVEIMEHWEQPVSRGSEVLQSGVYQVFRRYKPTFPQRRNFPAYRKDENHGVVCELAFVDSKRMECMLITAEHNVYWGDDVHQPSVNFISYRATSPWQ